jgi:hypothetical protein
MELPHPHLRPRAFWDARPGEPGPILVVGTDLDARRLRRRLPESWETIAASGPGEAMVRLPAAAVVCLCSLTDDRDSEAWREVGLACARASIPVLGLPYRPEAVTGRFPGFWTHMRPQGVFRPQSDSPFFLARWLLEHSTARVFSTLAEIWSGGVEGPSLLRAAYRLLARRAQEGVPLAGKGEVAEGLGCHRTSLWRAERTNQVDLSLAVRRVRVLFALCKCVGSCDEVAGSLGVCPSGVAHLFRRAMGCTRSEAMTRTYGNLLLWAAGPPNPSSKLSADATWVQPQGGAGG